MKPLLIMTIICAIAVTSAPKAEDPPNIIFILSDDQRYDELGCTGDPFIKTPNIDQLAKEGTLFDNSFVTSASCMPNRATLLTGQWERRHAIGWNNGGALSRDQWNNTLPALLRQAGYVTGYVGKNHVPGLRQWDYDYYYGSLDDHLGFYPKTNHPVFKNAKADTQIEILAQGALNFLSPDKEFIELAGELGKVYLKARSKDKPFFLQVCFNLPHGTGTMQMKQNPTDDELYRNTYRNIPPTLPPPPSYIASQDVREPKIPHHIYSGKQISQYDFRFSLEALREQKVRIYQTVSGIDRVVGQIREQLKQLGLENNTIIIYSSDNGLLNGEHGYGGKSILYDPSIRVPLIIFDPRISINLRGRRAKESVLSVDVAPTIMELSGLKPPVIMQGRSLAGLLRGKATEWRKDFFCESMILLQDYPLIQCVRSQEWKYLRYWSNRPRPNDYREVLNLGLNGEAPEYEELFQLSADPLEQSNQAANPEYREQIKIMRARCTELLSQARGAPEQLPTVSREAWLREAPAEWVNVLPLLSGPSRVNKGDRWK